MRATIPAKGQIVLSAELRVADDIKSEEELEVDRIGPHEDLLTRLTPPSPRGLVEWLRSCPGHDWFVEIESGSTAGLDYASWQETAYLLRSPANEQRLRPHDDGVCATYGLLFIATIAGLQPAVCGRLGSFFSPASSAFVRLRAIRPYRLRSARR